MGDELSEGEAKRWDDVTRRAMRCDVETLSPQKNPFTIKERVDGVVVELVVELSKREQGRIVTKDKNLVNNFNREI